MSDKEIKVEAFRQHWNQMRHTENLRHGFTYFYVLIVIGILAFVSQTPQTEHSPIYAVGIVLSIMGLVFLIRIIHSIDVHRNKACSLAKDLGIEESEIENYLPFTPESEGGARLPSIRKIFIAFYIVGLVGFIILLVLGKLDPI